MRLVAKAFASPNLRVAMANPPWCLRLSIFAGWLPKSSRWNTAECEQDSVPEAVKLSTQFRNDIKSLGEPVIPPHSFR